MAQVILNSSLCKTRNHWSCIVNNIVADDLATQGTSASAATILI